MEAEKNKSHERISERTSDLQPDEPFTIFTKWQKLWISLATAIAAMFSTMSSYIYLPALVPIAHELNVSILLVNLTVTSYLVVAGIAPAFMGDMTDQNSHRPVYILMFVLMIGVNAGIALQKSYPMLSVFRMIQSAGSSGTVQPVCASSSSYYPQTC